MVSIAALGLVVAGTIMADSPTALDKPDSHSVMVTGKISLFRVQIEDMNLGEGADKIRAEVFVQLDSKPGMVYGLSLHDPGSKSHDPVSQEMTDTLRAAYLNKVPVTLYYQIDLHRKNNFRITMVQLN